MEDFLALPFAASVSSNPRVMPGQDRVTLLNGRFDRLNRYTTPASEMGYMPVYDPQMVQFNNELEPNAALQTFNVGIRDPQHVRLLPSYADPALIRKRKNLEHMCLILNPHSNTQMVFDYATFGTWPSKPQLNTMPTMRVQSDINLFE